MKQFNEFLYEDKRTDFFETAACLGIVCGKVLINDINEFLEGKITKKGKITSNISKLLEKPYDWNKRGVSEVKKNFKDDILFLDILNLLLGMYMFVDKEVKIPLSKRNFIHNKINDYYKAEKKALGIKKGSKNNTADCVIINIDEDEFLKMLITKPIVSKEGYYTVDTHYSCYQVSLKKAEGGAQLGKIGKKLKAMNLFEGKIFDKIKKITKKSWNYIKQSVQKITSDVVKRFKKDISSNLETDVIELNRLISNGKKGFFESVLNEKELTQKIQETVDSMYKNKDNMLKEVNKNIKIIKNKSNEKVVVKIDILKNLKNFKSPDSVFKLSSNFSTTKTILKLIDDNETINEHISSLIKEMIFGGTELPLWIVYGKYSNTKPYSYLGTIDTYNKKGNIALETIGINISVKKGSHYIITLYFFDYMDDKNKYYIVMRTGTNSSSRFTYAISGAKKIAIPLDSTLKSFINKEK